MVLTQKVNVARLALRCIAQLDLFVLHSPIGFHLPFCFKPVCSVEQVHDLSPVAENREHKQLSGGRIAMMCVLI
jgi:hypothetical protein